MTLKTFNVKLIITLYHIVFKTTLGGTKMPNFDIFTDGSVDIPLKTAAEKSINIIPFYISFDYKNYYKELFEISRDDFFDKLINKELFPKTSLPSIQDYIDAFTPSLEKQKDIICFTITDTLSGSYQSALSAKDILSEKYKNNIYVLNTWLATGAMQLMVLEACKMRDNGLSAKKVYDICAKMKTDSRIMFMVGALTHLEKGGRIGKLAAISGGILKIKPLIELKNGEIDVAGIVRSRKNGLKKLIEITEEYFTKNKENPQNYVFTIGTTNTPNEVLPFFEGLKEKLKCNNFISPFYIGATIASHTGPDTVGVCFLKKYENYI